jgi:hypothetical protein
MIRLIYFSQTWAQMREHSTTIFRRFWRLVEVLLFFVVSVVGFALIGKTSSLASKAKERSRTHTAAPPQTSWENTVAFFLSGNTTVLQLITGTKSHRADNTQSATHRAPHFPQTVLSLPQYMNEAYATAFRTLLSHNATLQPRSLFQQSPVLLI